MRSILRDGGTSSLTQIARTEALAPATAYRLAASLVAEGMLLPIGGGRHAASPQLLDLVQGLSLRPAMVGVARPVVRQLARESGSVAHLGIMDDDMVTYLVKEGRSRGALFTEEGKQLEAYCSGIGKILLAALPQDERNRYIATGPFIALTPNTITDGNALTDELTRVARLGYAEDQEEIAMGLHCLAIAINAPSGAVIAALSISRGTTYGRPDGPPAHLGALIRAKARIETKLFG